MATIQEKLSVLANTVEKTEDLTNEQLSQGKKKLSVVDFKMVTFSLAGKDYAIDIMKVKEIAKAGCFTYVPNALPFVLGVYNLRGDIIPIIDLRLFFNSPVPEHDDNFLENMLIVTVGEQTFGVVVDAIDICWHASNESTSIDWHTVQELAHFYARNLSKCIAFIRLLERCSQQ